MHHRGAGHRMTAAAVIPRLPAEVTVFTSAAEVPEAARTIALPLDTDTDLDTSAAATTASGGGPTAHGALHWAPTASAGHTARLASIARWVAEARPDAFVVDLSVEVAAFVRLLGVPVITFTLPGRRDDPAHRLGYALSDAVIAAWPADIGPEAPSAPPERLHRVGALSRFAPVAGRPAPVRFDAPVIVLHGAGGRGENPVAQAAERMRAVGLPVRELRGAGSAEVWQQLRAAPLVVSHCGASAVAEIAAARRPAVLIPDARPHDEQQHLAASLAAAGLPCRILTPDAVAGADWITEHRLALALDGAGWSRWNDGLAARRIADVIAGLATGRPALGEAA
ncbi:glycosyltransferase [Herbiconiux sp. P18]|uniref:glycosyltransferase n=1 Tax=Herbiconiux liangxiaofengii TaxID=3342795 RepID=UPI0035BAD296